MLVIVKIRDKEYSFWGVSYGVFMAIYALLALSRFPLEEGAGGKVIIVKGDNERYEFPHIPLCITQAFKVLLEECARNDSEIVTAEDLNLDIST